MGYEEYDNNRSTRIFNLINEHKSIDYNKFKAINKKSLSLSKLN